MRSRVCRAEPHNNILYILSRSWYTLIPAPSAAVRGHLMWLFDSNSTKVANTNKYQTAIVELVSKQYESPARYSSISYHPQSPGWCLIIIWDRGLLQNTSAFQEIHPPTKSSSHPTPVLFPSPGPPPVGAETGVLSPSRSTSTANLAGRWRLECDKSICPGLNLYANLK